MADALPMAQIPNPSPVSVSAPQYQNPGMALWSGVNQGAQIGLQAEAQRAQQQQFQQQLAMQQKQQAIEKNMKMLETGSQMMLEGGPEVQATGQSLIQQSYPFLTGQPLPQGMPLDKNTAKDLGWYMDQHRLWQKTNGADGLSAQDAVTGATQAVSNYGAKYQQNQMALLEKTPMYKEATATQEPGQINGQSVNFNPQSGQSTAQGTGQVVPGDFVPNTTIAREQNTRQMGAASAAAPVIGNLATYHTIQSALSRGDQIGDRTAILEAGKFLGETPEQMQKLAKSGFFGDNLVQYAEKGFGTSDMTATQRTDFQNIMNLHMQGLQKASQTQTSMYPGATGPNLSTPTPPITKTLKNGKTAVSSDGGKTWFYSK